MPYSPYHPRFASSSAESMIAEGLAKWVEETVTQSDGSTYIRCVLQKTDKGTRTSQRRE